MSTIPRDLIKQYEDEVLNYLGPHEFSWLGKGILSHVRDQKFCGVCWAFVIADSIQSQFAIEMVKKNYLPRLNHLAPQVMLDCFKDKFPEVDLPDDDEMSCYANSYQNGFMYVNKYGLCEEKHYPYLGEPRPCGACSLKVPKYFVDNIQRFELDPNDIRICKAVDERPLPGMIGFTAVMLQALSEHKDGVFQTLTLQEIKILEEKGEQVDYHCVLIVGFGTEKDGTTYFIIKNTWGQTWCKFGYGKLARSGFFSFVRQTTTTFK